MMKRTFTRLCRVVLVCVTALLAVATLNAQVSTYNFSQSTGTYTPITGGTVVGYSTVDDAVFNGLPVGFSFVYNNAAYTTWNVNGNGWISLGAATQSATSPLSNTNTGPTTNNVISAAGADLVGGLRFTATTTNASNVLTVVSDVYAMAVGDTVTATNLPAGTTVTSIDTANNTVTVSQAATATGTLREISVNNGEIRYQVLGSSPTQVLVVQFSNYRRYNQSNVELNFQIKLYETTGQIEIQYGVRQLAANTTNNPLQVGLRGATSADYNNRTSTTTWTATTAGGSNSATVRLSSTVTPPAGHSYFWNAPNCVAPGNVTVSNVTSTGAIVTFRKPLLGAPQSYEWRLVPGTNAATNGVLQNGYTASANDTVVNIGSLTQLTTYSVYVRSVCGAGDTSAFTTIATFTTPCPAITSIPWTESFESIVSGTNVTGEPTCWAKAIASGSNNWSTRATPVGTNNRVARTGTDFAYTQWSTQAWLITPGFSLTAGTKYEFSFYGAASSIQSSGHSVRVAVGAAQSIAGMTTTLGMLNNVLDTNYVQNRFFFTPSTSGVYYFGLKDSTPSFTPDYYLTDDYALNIVPTCTAAVAGTTSASANPACVNQAITLNITGGGTEDGVTYQWISSTDGINYTPVNGATAASLVTTYPGATYYRNIVSCSFSATADTSTVLMVTPNSYENCYCIPGFSDCTDGDIIDSISFAGINLASGCSNNGYSFTTTPVASAMKTITYPIAVSVGDAGGFGDDESVAIWIDYDHSGTFDTSEFKLIGYDHSTTIPNNVTIPGNALTGQTRMRVRARYSTVLTNTMACTTYGYGETEDYLINIVDLPACTNPPVAGTISGDTTVCTGNVTQLTLNGYTLGTQLQWQKSTDNVTWTNVANATTALVTTDTITGTLYYRARVVCVDTSYSAVVSVVLAPVYECYCAGFTQNCNDGDVIVRVQFGNLDNNTGYACNNGGYTMFSSPVDTFYTGNIEQMTVTVGDGGTENVAVWIDYNHNGVFDTNEFTALGSANDDDVVNNISIPAGADTGLTVMRVRVRFSTALTSGQACFNGFTYGETEDYLIYLAPPPPCAAPIVAGTINGPSTTQIDSTETYVLTGFNGNIQWQYSNTVAAGPYINFTGSTNDSIDITFLGADTFYIRAYLTGLGCDPDSTAPFQVIVAKKAGDDVCDAIQLNFGVNGPFSTGGATVQAGEVVPEDLGCGVQNGWCNSDLNATMWFKFTAPASGRVRVQSPGSAGNYDSQLALWAAPSCDSLLSATGATLVAANDDDGGYSSHGGGQFSSYIDSAICLTPGATYYVQLDQYGATALVSTIVLTDLGPGPVAAFTNLDTAYCVNAAPVTLTPAGGTFTGAGVTGNVFTPSAAGVGGPYVISRNYYACYTYSDTVYTVYAAPSLTVADTTDVLCNGGNTGAVDITVTGGTTPYAFTWTGGSTNEDLSGVTAGSYSVTVTDLNGCSATGAATIAEPAALFLGLDSTVQVSCPGASTGAAYVTVSGGVSPYVYAWSNQATTEDITGLLAGQYTLTVTDANNCSIVSNPVTITQPAPISIIVISTTNVNCNGGTNGGINITVTGGNAPYTYLWSNGVTTQDITNSPAGTYTPTITDSKGCTLVGQTFTITEPAVLAITVDSTKNASCSTNTDGEAYVTVTGGTTPYSYNWSNTTSQEDLIGVVAGAYTLTVTDSRQCSATAAATVGANANIALTVDSVHNAVCAGGSTGAVYITATSGVAPYIYTWSNSTTNEDLTNVAANTYTVTVNDGNGCSTTASATVADGYALNAVVDSTHDVSCNGGANGEVFTTPTNGAAPYVYVWSNSASTEDISGLAAGTYTLTLTDANGCTYNGLSATVTAPTAVVLTSVVTDQVGTANNGAIDVTVSGGTAPYTSVWSNNATGEDLTAISAGIYTTTVTDANGCTASKTDTVDLITGIDAINGTYSVAMYPNPTMATATVEVKLENANDVTVEVFNITGQLVTSAKEYGVSNAKFNFDFTNQAAGVYNTKITIGDKVITKRLVVNK